nr:MAG TPA: hypothetical protein [Caudoviricetes sp.]
MRASVSSRVSNGLTEVDWRATSSFLRYSSAFCLSRCFCVATFLLLSFK